MRNPTRILVRTADGKLVRKEDADEQTLTGWDKARASWHAAMQFARAMASRGLLDKRAPAETRALRVLSCHGDGVTAPCTSRAYSVTGKFHYCNDCQCGETEVARLDAKGSDPATPRFDPADYDKLDYPVLICPRSRPGFTPTAPVRPPGQ